MPAGARVWWAATPAVEEYEDALLAEFAAGIADAERAALPDRDVVLPFANLRQATGERKATGLTGSLLPEPVEPPRPPTRVVVAARRRRRGRGRLAAAEARTGARQGRDGPSGRVGRGRGRAAAGTPTPEVAPPVEARSTVEGAARLRAELETLTKVKRPEVIARIRAAKELGDLKENADYSSAREEQSFLEGRVQAIEARLRTAVIVDAAGGRRADRARVGGQREHRRRGRGA